MSLLSKSILPKDKPQIITTRLIAAPRELLWKVLTTPEHLKHFWGPDGFTNSFKTFDLRVGHEARFTMHGPDGTNWPNRFVFLAIDAPRLLRWDHDNGGEGPHPAAALADGERVIAFLGSCGLACFDFDGKLQWDYAAGKELKF